MQMIWVHNRHKLAFIGLPKVRHFMIKLGKLIGKVMIFSNKTINCKLIMKEMNLQDRIASAAKLIEQDNYIDAFKEFATLHCENPRNEEIVKVCIFLFDRITEGNYDFEPETAQEYLYRGVARFYKGDPSASIVDYDKAIALDSEFDYAFKCKAFSLTFMGKYHSAIDYLEQAIAMSP